MIPLKLIGRALTPDKSAELQLHQRGADFFILLDGKELMSSRKHGSEEALAELACAPIAGRAKARVLVGGAPLNEEFAASIGADAYCRDAAVAVDTAKELLAQAG